MWNERWMCENEDETMSIGVKNETFLPPPHQQHLLYTSNGHQTLLHIFFITKKTRAK